MDKFGIDQVKVVLALIIEAGNVADQFEKARGMARYMTFTSLFDELMAMGNFDKALFIKQIKELSDAEIVQLHGFLKAKFDIVDELLENTIEEGIAIFIDMYAIYERTTKLVKSFKKPEVA